jgi:hypothetical protein
MSRSGWVNIDNNRSALPSVIPVLGRRQQSSAGRQRVALQLTDKGRNVADAVEHLFAQTSGEFVDGVHRPTRTAFLVSLDESAARIAINQSQSFSLGQQLVVCVHRVTHKLRLYSFRPEAVVYPTMSSTTE